MCKAGLGDGPPGRGALGLILKGWGLQYDCTSHVSWLALSPAGKERAPIGCELQSQICLFPHRESFSFLFHKTEWLINLQL